MGFDDVFSVFNISSSGLAAERIQLDVIANNIANANTTRDVDGKPYCRKQVVFSSILSDALSGRANRFGQGNIRGENLLGGVTVLNIIASNEKFKSVYDPHHPDANKDGYVLLPNVNIIHEMADMISASRAYEANLAVMGTSKEMLDRAINIIRA